MTPTAIVKHIEGHRWPLADEKVLQRELAVSFERSAVAYEREVNLGDGDVIDFIVGDIGIELKIKGQRRAIYRQCLRYLRHERVQQLVLATNAPMGMPEAVGGKRIYVASLGRGWL